MHPVLIFAPPLDKIGGASEKKIEQALFFPLGLHYLCIMKKLLALIIICIAMPVAAQAQRLDVSLLTCFPGQEVFEL